MPDNLNAKPIFHIRWFDSTEVETFIQNYKGRIPWPRAFARHLGYCEKQGWFSYSITTFDGQGIIELSQSNDEQTLEYVSLRWGDIEDKWSSLKNKQFRDKVIVSE